MKIEPIISFCCFFHCLLLTCGKYFCRTIYHVINLIGLNTYCKVTSSNTDTHLLLCTVANVYPFFWIRRYFSNKRRKFTLFSMSSQQNTPLFLYFKSCCSFSSCMIETNFCWYSSVLVASPLFKVWIFIKSINSRLNLFKSCVEGSK